MGRERRGEEPAKARVRGPSRRTCASAQRVKIHPEMQSIADVPRAISFLPPPGRPENPIQAWASHYHPLISLWSGILTGHFRPGKHLLFHGPPSSLFLCQLDPGMEIEKNDLVPRKQSGEQV